MTTRRQELKNSIEDLREELSKFESELEGLDELTIKKGDIVRIVSTLPTVFTTGSPFVIGAYCKVVCFSEYGKNRIIIKLHKSVWYDTNICETSQVELVWSS